MSRSSGSRARLPVRVVGLGAWHRGDDAAGLLAVRRIGGAVADRAEVVEGISDPASFVLAVEGALHLVIVDALRDRKRRCGAVICRELHPGVWTLASQSGLSSHGDALTSALALARHLDALPERVTLVGVIGDRFGLGAEMSPAVERALPELGHAALMALVGTGILMPPAGRA